MKKKNNIQLSQLFEENELEKLISILIESQRLSFSFQAQVVKGSVTTLATQSFSF